MEAKSKPRILVVGCANVDIIASGCLSGPKGDLLGVYERYELKCGGKGANQACAAAALGADCTFLGRVGKDSFGETLLQGLAHHGIDTSRVVVDPDIVTGVSPIFLRPDKGYDSYNLLGANGRISVDDVKAILDGNTFDLVMMQLEMPQETVYFTYRYASSKGIPVVLDAGPVREWPLEPLKGIYMISPNETEAFHFTGIRPVDEASAAEAARILRDRTDARYVVIKMGAKGAYVCCREAAGLFHGYEPDKAIDTTGCGDAFTAAVAMGLYYGYDISTAVRLGNSAGALCSRKVGAWDAIPGWDDVVRYMKEMTR